MKFYGNLVLETRHPLCKPLTADENVIFMNQIESLEQIINGCSPTGLLIVVIELLIENYWIIARNTNQMFFYPRHIWTLVIYATLGARSCLEDITFPEFRWYTQSWVASNYNFHTYTHWNWCIGLLNMRRNTGQVCNHLRSVKLTPSRRSNIGQHITLLRVSVVLHSVVVDGFPEYFRITTMYARNNLNKVFLPARPDPSPITSIQPSRLC